MTRSLPLALAAALAFHLAASAQQIGDNINVLPIVPDSPLKGDLYLQRQVEPSIVVSTRNPNHLAAFYIDYRTVYDVTTDVNSGGEGPQLSAGIWPAFKGMLAKLLGRPTITTAERPHSAASPGEANIGYSRSRDGGLTWSGALLPGLSFDTNVPSPIKNYAATTDPVAVAGPCGTIYLAFIAFNRGASSAFVVAKFLDLDNSTRSDHTIVYKGMSVVETGNNGTNGVFYDKPDFKIDLDRARGATGCAHRLYATYSVFNGLDKAGKFQSKVKLATIAFSNADEQSSIDGVTAWTKGEISGSYTQNQGTAMAVDPVNGDLYVFWRHFNKPQTILVAKGAASLAAGARLGKPLPLFTNLMAPFDQPPVTTDYGADSLAFRSNGYPTAAVSVDDNGKSHVFAAWQERVDATGAPNATLGSPRIVMTRSDDGGTIWTPRAPADVGIRAPEPAGLGFAQPFSRPALPQVMPTLSGGPQPMLVYYEDRVRPGDVVAGLGPQGLISGYNRVLDLRGAVLDKATGAVIRSFQISRYPIKSWAQNPATSNTIADLEPVNPPCSPDFGAGYKPCVPRINRVAPTTQSGKVPFIGDYTALTPSASFVPNGSGGWKWALKASDVPWVGAHAAFNDGRNIVPPLPADGTEWNQYIYYSPPGAGCSQNPGSRNTDIMTSRISLGLMITSPLTWRQTPAEFPFTVWNNTGTARYFELSADTTDVNVGFGKPDAAYAGTKTGRILILPYSSSAHVLYINESGSPSMTVKVTEVAGYTGNTPVANALTGQIKFNAESAHPPLLATSGTTKALEVSNPFPQTPFPQTTDPLNPFPQTPFPQTPFPQTPFPQTAAAQDVSWTVSAPTVSADTVAAYLALIGIDKAYWANYGFQLFISKTSTVGALTPDCSRSFNLSQGTVIANYYLPSLTTANPFPQTASTQNPFPQTATPENPFPQTASTENSAFTIAPSESTGTTLTAAVGETENPAAPDLYTITLRAFLNPNAPTASPGFVPFNPAKNPPVLKVAEKNCVPGVGDCFLSVSDAPELIIATSPPLTPPDLGSVSPGTVPAGGAVAIQNAATIRNIGKLVASDRRHGYYLVPAACALPTWDSPVNGDTVSSCAVLITDQPFASPNDLAPLAQENVLSSVTIPLTTTPGTYRLLVYADWRREVSEFNEYNNWAVTQPFTITPPQYTIIGLFSPCVGLTCTKSSGSVLPLAWQFSYDGVTAVDSSGTQPMLKIYTADASWNKTSPNPLFTADPRDISAGSSLWQYFTVAGTRPAFTWQYNWQTKIPGTNTNLLAGNYLAIIEVPSTNQTESGKGAVATVRVTLTP